MTYGKKYIIQLCTFSIGLPHKLSEAKLYLKLGTTGSQLLITWRFLGVMLVLLFKLKTGRSLINNVKSICLLAVIKNLKSIGCDLITNKLVISKDIVDEATAWQWKKDQSQATNFFEAPTYPQKSSQ